MNKFKSLSDSSTSESESDDLGKRKTVESYDTWTGSKRTRSTDEEEPQVEFFYNVKEPFKAPSYSERNFSTDDTEDEIVEFKGEFMNPAQYIERELETDHTDSDSEEKSAPVKGVANMPSLATLNGHDNVGMKLMKKMGYKTGTGLGKYEQGRVEIVEASKQRGRRGFGLIVEGLEASDATWDSSLEEISVKEEVAWIPECKVKPLRISQLRKWMVEGKKKETIDDEIEFCDPMVLEKVLSCKSVFDKLEGEEMRKARTKSNPFETIRGGIFLNRAAMKMANMDCAFDFMFTNPKLIDGKSAVGDNELLYFADVCAGPGGFSEYVLWRRKWECKGFGFTLKGPNDFKLDDFFAGPPETFEPHYGDAGDGDIYNPRNLRCFKEFVRSNTDGKGVHFVMADGGFSVDGRENEQEILSKRLYLCQFLCALFILRTGGHFVCKLFDLFTPFSVGLVYLMYHAFEKVSIFKPNTSRPANSERYIVCKWLKENTKDIADYMYEINDFFDTHQSLTSDADITDVVPLNLLKENEEFYDYIVNSNNTFGAKQVIHLQKIRIFAQNEELREERQNDLRKESLKLWGVPDEARAVPPKCTPNDKFKTLLQGEILNYFNAPSKPLTLDLLKKLDNVFDFHCIICGESQSPPSLFIGLGKSNIYQLDSKTLKWRNPDLSLELPADTLFYGELVQELKGEARAQLRITSLHIIDALYLGGKDVRHCHYENRMQLAEKLVKAVSKHSKTGCTPLRVKQIWQLSHIEDVFDRFSMKKPKNSRVPRLCFDLEDERHIIASGLLIFKTTSDPWVTAFSKTNQRTYLFNIKKNISVFERNKESFANFKQCFTDRIFWSWVRGVRIIPDHITDPIDSAVQGQTLLEFVKGRLLKMTGRPY